MLAGSAQNSPKKSLNNDIGADGGQSDANDHADNNGADPSADSSADKNSAGPNTEGNDDDVTDLVDVADLTRGVSKSKAVAQGKKRAASKVRPNALQANSSRTDISPEGGRAGGRAEYQETID
jgi:hypothetical protein